MTTATKPKPAPALAPRTNSPDELITLMQASEETGLHRSTLWKQTKIMDGSGRPRLQIHDYAEASSTPTYPTYRASGGGKVIRMTRRALHMYLLSRAAGRPLRLIHPDYRAPEGMQPLPARMLRTD